MKALLFEGPDQIRFSTIPNAKLADPNDVIVQVKIAGLCGSDLHIYRGHETGLDHGTAMGHEFVGEVVEVGEGVVRFRKGDMVISPFTTSCGHCFYCVIGLTCRCESGRLFGWRESGKGLHGAQAELVRVPMADTTLLPLTSDLSPEIGLFLGDILSTGYFCAVKANIHPKGVYVVLGCGPVGLMAVKSAIQLGATQVYAIDALANRLQKAELLGAIPVSLKKEGLKETILQATNSRGADSVMEAVGSSAASRLAMDLVRPGGIISTVGVHTSQQFAFSPVEAYDKNLTFHIGRCPARHYMEQLAPVVASWELNPDFFISHRLPLSKGREAYRIFDQKLDNCLKVIFTP